MDAPQQPGPSCTELEANQTKRVIKQPCRATRYYDGTKMRISPPPTHAPCGRPSHGKPGPCRKQSSTSSSEEERGTSVLPPAPRRRAPQSAARPGGPRQQPVTQLQPQPRATCPPPSRAPFRVSNDRPPLPGSHKANLPPPRRSPLAPRRPPRSLPRARPEAPTPPGD